MYGSCASEFGNFIKDKRVKFHGLLRREEYVEFSYNEICVISDGLEAKVGSYTAPFSRFSTWKAKDGLSDASPFEDELSVTLNGLFNRNTLIDYILNFVAFEKAKIENDEKKIIRIETVFGNYIDIYDIAQAVEDKITVKIYYESRLAKVNLTEEGRALVEQFDTELESPSESDEALSDADEAKAKWTTLEKIVGNPERIKNVANDIVRHFEARQEVFEGKATIVAMSRRIAVDLYDAIISLRPEWYNDDLNKGCIKVVMTSSSSDEPNIQKHHTAKSQRKALAARMKDVNDPLKIVIVRDMWLTGFDAPCLHTMYVDKPMKGHNLMQAIARVNRVFLDKPGGLIVDYIGIGTSLKQALNFYAESGGKGMPAENQIRATEIMIEKLEVVRPSWV